MRCLLSLLLTAGVTAVAAQDHVPVTTPGTRWLNHVITPFDEHVLDAVDIGPDTVINGAVYKRTIGMIPGAMREDGGQVWFQPDDTSNYEGLVDGFPILLYDFNLQAGDSFPMPLQAGVWAHVVERDSIQLLGGGYRDRLVLSGPWELPASGEWVEGIGDASFIFGSIWLWWEAGVWLECYGINDDPLYGYCLYLGEEVQEAAIAPRLVPDGTGGRYRIEGLPDLDRGVETWDMSGRRLAVPFVSPNLIDLSRQPPGVYALRVSSAGASFAFKVVVDGP